MKARILFLGIFAVTIASCGAGEAEGTTTSTLSADEIQTAAIGTFSAALTQTALAAPTDTPVPTLTASATFPPLATITGNVPLNQPTSAATSSCYRLVFVSDVSVPDNTAMTPGQAFIKTWKVSNTGTCSCDAGFKFSFVNGDAMNGTTYTLPSAVPPDGVVDISVNMTAPVNKVGTVRGDWRMSTADGKLFGDFIYVQILVTVTTGTPPTSNPGTATATNTPVTPSATPTTPAPPP